MHMINDKGEAVYFNPIRKNGKDQWLIQGIGSSRALAPPSSWAVTVNGARAGPLPSIPRRSATWPSTALGPIDFSAGKNAPGNT